jgi:hypothetical protein
MSHHKLEAFLQTAFKPEVLKRFHGLQDALFFVANNA